MSTDDNTPKNEKMVEDSEGYTEQQSKPIRLRRFPPDCQFQKNYPKNLFIPVIEYLAEIGLRQRYQKSVGTREQFEGKNVVSLGLIYRLLSEPWFQISIDRKVLLSNVSNKILMNSKIKKKLFHLMVAHCMFSGTYHDARHFKKIISKQAYNIAIHLRDDSELFRFPSSTIYLLHLFCQAITSALSQDHSGVSITDSLSLNENSFSNQNIPKNSFQEKKCKQVGSKEEYKLYIKKIVNVFNSPSQQSHELMDTLQYVKQAVLLGEQQVRQKYGFGEHIPNWSPFIQLVVQKCFLSKRKGIKLTNSLLNEWIHEFKDYSTTTKGFQDSHYQPRNRFCPIVIIKPQIYRVY